ncbi:MAG TPA: choice-of-anchor R domain-containing protein [Terriglobales bacterium]|nr:choice-of-anchor R domain-containing protein [Terriglobales bacterium]
MCKKALLTFTVLALASLTAFAANKDGIVLSKDGRMTIATKPTPSVTRTERNEAGLVHIYDNLGTAYPKGEYWCCEGFTITGPTAITGFPEYWSAAAFTPSAAHTVTKVEVAVGYVEGYNGLIIGLYSDASGVPGKAIKTWSVTGLPNFGACCAVATATDSTGISVTGGTQYWIVVKTNSKSSNTYGAWNVNDTDQVDSAPAAQYCSQDKGGSCSTNDKWTAFSSQPGLAFAVLGK